MGKYYKVWLNEKHVGYKSPYFLNGENYIIKQNGNIIKQREFNNT